MVQHQTCHMHVVSLTASCVKTLGRFHQAGFSGNQRAVMLCTWEDRIHKQVVGELWFTVHNPQASLLANYDLGNGDHEHQPVHMLEM